MSLIKSLLIILVVVLASFIQRLEWLSIIDIKPNIVIAILIPIVFFIDDFILYFILVMGGLLFLKTEPIFDLPVFILAILLLFDYWLVKILPWQKVFNLFIVISGTTAIFYTIISWRFIFNHPTLFIGEVLYNLILGLVFYYLLDYEKI